MAELLLYRGPHWMDSLVESQIKEYEKKCHDFRKKYNHRLKRGDILEVGIDNKWKNPSSDKFIHIKLPGVDPKELEYLIDSDYEGEINPDKIIEKPEVRNRKRYNFQVNLLSAIEKQDIENGKSLTFSKTQTLNLIKDKSFDYMGNNGKSN